MVKNLTFAACVLMGLALTSCGALQGTTGATSSTNATSSTAASAGQEVLGTLLNGVVSSAVSSTDQSGVSGILGNLLSSVTGSTTTTQATLQGTWSYTEPCVQFESENTLAQAGGTAAAAKVESQLADLYKKVGFSAGKMVFTFGSNGEVTYNVGSYSRTGTYVFDSTNKTVTITTSAGVAIKAYVTVSGQNMSLCFDSSKFLTYAQALGASGNATLSTISTLAGSFSGMKTGFKFTK